MLTKLNFKTNSAMHLISNTPRTARSPARKFASRGLRYSALALAIASALPLWAQTSFNSQPANLLGSGNSNLPANSPRVFAAQVAEVDYSLNSKVALIRVAVAQNSLPADGQTPARLAISVRGQDGELLQGTLYLTVETSAGRIQIPGASTDEFGPGSLDQDKVTRSTQVKVIDGKADLLLIAPSLPQDVTVRITAGRVRAEGIISFVPELREMLAVGLVEGIIRFDAKSPLQLTGARRDDGFEQEIHNFANSSKEGKRYSALRSAFFLKGKIKGDALLTMAYDSDKDTYSRLFRSVRPDEYYAVYGDSSLRGFDAQSSSKMYVRVDKDKSYLLWGDFNTGDGFSQQTGGGNVANIRKRDLGNYSRSMNGARAHYDQDGILLNGFATKDNLVQLVEEFPAQGISGPFAVSKHDAVAGSEKVEIITRDRYQPSVILSTTSLQRYADYSFEPFSGRILLNQPLPSVDMNGNPKSLRVTYEVDSGGETFWVVGVDGQIKAGERTEFGASYVSDKNPYAPYTLMSANASYKPGENSSIVAEFARSNSVLGASTTGGAYSLQPAYGQPAPAGGSLQEVEGNAWRIEALHQDNTLKARLFLGRSDAYFNNAAASLSQGREEAALKVTDTLNEQWTAYVEGTHSKQRIADASRDAFSAGAIYAVNSSWDIDLGLTHTKEEAGNYAGALLSLGSGLLVDPQSKLGFGYGSSLINPQTGYGLDGGNYGLAGVSYSSTGLRLRSTYRVSEKVDVFGEYEHGVDGAQYHRAALGAAYRFSEVGRVYAKYEWTTGLSSPQAVNGIYDSNAFVLGLDTEYLPNQKVFSEYRMRDAVSGEQLQWANGMRNSWNLSDTVKLSTSAEYLRIYRGETQDAYALTGGVEWRPNELWMLGARLEWRRLKDGSASQSKSNSSITPTAPAIPVLLAGNDTWMSTLTAARKINRDWTFLGRNYLLDTDNRGHSGNRWEDKLQLGLAYRDTDTNRFSALARYEYWVQRDKSGSNSYLPPYGSDGLSAYPGDPTASQGFDKHIVSLQGEYHPSRPWWLSGRTAAKWQRDHYELSDAFYSAYLISGRATYDIAKRWDISGLASNMYSPQGKARQRALGVELGYQLQDNLWLSAGYNWRGYSDRDLIGNDYTNRGVFLRIRFKFDEDLFAARNPASNPSLAR
ncbi:hypothetical protein [Undibacterium sp. Ren11W]|uniref:hypothetical protein n=1 Tax=Undibacterium sp. Ren11W TaxID=3413045 RepID=UPI003BF47C51